MKCRGWQCPFRPLASINIGGKEQIFPLWAPSVRVITMRPNDLQFVRWDVLVKRLADVVMVRILIIPVDAPYHPYRKPTKAHQH